MFHVVALISFPLMAVDLEHLFMGLFVCCFLVSEGKSENLSFLYGDPEGDLELPLVTSCYLL